jgi:hypothetical protein
MQRDSSPLHIRFASEKDSDPIDALIEARHARYAGPIDRERQPREYPAVDTYGRPITYIVAEADGREVGVVGVTEDGALVDWGVPKGEARIADALLAAAEDWARERGAEDSRIMIAVDEASLARVLERRGYRRPGRTYTVMRIESFSKFLTAVLGARADELTGMRPLTALIHLEPGLYPPLSEPDITVNLRNGSHTVAAEPSASADFVVETTATDFSEYLLGGLSRRTLLLRRSTIRPSTRILDVLRFLKILRPLSSWYWPLGERR